MAGKTTKSPVSWRVAVWFALLVMSGLCCAQPATADRLASAYLRQPNHTSIVYSVAFSPDG